MATCVDSIADAVSRFAVSHSDIVAVYVFGSVAAGRNRASSDLDLAIFSRRRMSGDERIAYETELSSMLHRDVDLVVFGQSGALLQHQILKSGRLVYESDPAERVRQEVMARAEYLDTRLFISDIKGCKAWLTGK